MARALVKNASLTATPVGTVKPYAGTAAPDGFLLCYGQAVSRTTYSRLFTAIGTTFGVGDGSTTFNLPDVRGRAIFGKDDMGGSAASRITSGVSGITGATLGAAGGNEILHQHNHGPGTFATSLSGTFASSSHGHTSGTIVACMQAVGGNKQFRNVTPPTAWTTTHNFAGNSANSESNSQPSFSIATVGTTASDNASASLGGSNSVAGASANAGTASSQNMPPTIIMNAIIKV